MTNCISNRAFTAGVRRPIAAFCRTHDIWAAFLSIGDDGEFQLSCGAADYPFVMHAADAIEESQAAEAAWLAEYLSNPKVGPCARGHFADPLASKLGEIARDHFWRSGRAERCRREYDAATCAMKCAERSAKGAPRKRVRTSRHVREQRSATM